MRRRRRTWLAFAALALAVGALPTLAPEAQDAPEGETPAPRAEVVRELGEPPMPNAPADIAQEEQSAAQEQWDAERDELLAEQERVAAELAALRQLNANLQNDRQTRWMLVGGGLVLVGIVVGALIKSRPMRRDAWQ